MYCQQSVYLPAAADDADHNNRLYGCLIEPTGRPRFRVLILPPFLEARKSAARPLVEIARRLAGEGGVVLIVDPRGCGDSPGELSEVTLDDWLGDFAGANRRLADAYPGIPLLWMGMRLSAGLCLSAALAPAADGVSAALPSAPLRPDGLVLWAPLLDGEAALRQWAQRRRVNQMLTRVAQESLTDLLARFARGESVDFDGFPLSAAFARRLRAFDATGARTSPAAQRPETLALLPQPDTALETRLRPLLPDATLEVRRMAPFWNSVGWVDTAPFADATLAWVSRLAALNVSGRPTHPPCGLPASPAPRLPQPFSIGPAGNCLRGLYHAPPSTVAPRGKLLMLHGWGGCRLGPQRLFVRTARRLAQAGYGVLRLDFRGRGESDGDAIEASMASMMRDGEAALAWLRAQPPATPDGTLGVLGICSGCKVALHLVARAPAVGLAVLWSPEPMGRLRAAHTHARKTRKALLAYLRKLGNPESWRKLLRGRVRFGMVGKAVWQHETRGEDEARLENAALDGLRHSRTRLLFIHGGGDPEAAQAEPVYGQFCRTHGLAAESHRIEGANHNFSAVQWEAALIARTLTFLGAESGDAHGAV